MLSTGLLLGGLASLAAAQFPPPSEGVKVIKSKLHENVTISFKEVRPALSSVYVSIKWLITANLVAGAL